MAAVAAHDGRARGLGAGRYAPALGLMFASLGVIYGDIGTSPLYVLSGIFGSDAPVEKDVIGAISAIIWSLTLVPVFKYCLIALALGSGAKAEGGPFALFTALYKSDEEPDDIGTTTLMGTRTLTRRSDDKPTRSRFLDRPLIHTGLLGVALFSVALTISDGILTPAVSVVSAVSGLAVAVPSLEQSAIQGIAIAILVVLFALQPLGTAKLGFTFAPIIAIWLALLLVTGCYNVALAPRILRAFDPSRAILWFIRGGRFDVLAGVLLAITGCEAMFANLAQFSASAIRVAFIGAVYPALVFAYLGQGAALINEPENVIASPFYNSIPGPTGGGLWYTIWLFGILATIIASQAMISAVFSLVTQLIAYQAIPAFKVTRTSDSSHGQVYVAAANWPLMIGVIALIGAFGTSSNLTNAYGLAVSGVLVITSIFLALTMVNVFRLPILLALAFFAIFGFVDALFFSSSLSKVPSGAWVPLMIAVVLGALTFFWTWAKSLEHSYARENRIRVSSLLARADVPDGGFNDEEEAAVDASSAGTSDIAVLPPDSYILQPSMEKTDGEVKKRVGLAHVVDAGNSLLRLVGSHGKEPLARLPVLAIFHRANAINGLPASFASFVRAYPALPAVGVFLHVKTAQTPTVADLQDRIVSVERVRTIAATFNVTIRFGYREAVDISGIMGEVIERIVALERSVQDEGAGKRADSIKAVSESTITHFLPAYTVEAVPLPPHSSIIRKVQFSVRRFLIEDIYARLALLFDETADHKFGEAATVIRLRVRAAI